ncbi:MAG: chain length determinant protein EpsF [Oxalicibacterium faecigallinarum]|uniref:Chain length determinant protein EpsF n=2 Tax=Oxalicibacterium faecigallinarum TaxID=573741 RepID=A0A8J3AK35_9BURK|nr:chain length determinant protein EpsF [Oxalicibacterium faecigallinarum]MDQ7969251.1 chain length determinant protein EpsF [Oxalicibacterium faecigallinarum]GGI16032.1 hypothetical protein GCM10008066_01930 [Oxalicibacterium faecigallinarum]
MNITQFFLILLARSKIILITLFSVVGLTMLVALMLPNSYTASTSLVLNYKGVDPVTGTALPSQLMPGYMATQIDIIKSKTVALKVVDEMKLTESQGMRDGFADAGGEASGVSLRDWIATVISGGVDVEPSRDSGVITISYKSADAKFAADMANAFARAYQNAAVELKVDPSQKASDYLNAQIKTLRSNFETAQRRLSQYQQEHNIDNADNRLDVESARLNELSSQLVVAQGMAIEANSRERAASRNAGESPDVMSNGVIQGLRSNLATAEAKFAEVAQRLNVNHPQYQSAKAEVDKLRANLNQQIGLASSSVRSNARIQQQREAEIQAALTAQREKVMQLNLARDELKLLSNEVQTAQRAYEAAANRYTQTSLEARSTQSDVAVLNQATPPLSPTGPKTLLMLVLSVFVGGMLGLGLALVAEIMDRRVRSSRDLIEALNVPVLGVLRQERGAPRLGMMRPILPST